ncbi:MAG TPA: STAS domain-containing protein [Gammaproteobacteria bacterium]|nr:STAS domain-containing protein [Gammaproteobacteria bacterium]
MTEAVEFESLGNGRFIVSGDLSFATAEVALDEGERLFEHFQEIDLDFAHLGKTDSAGLAVLIEWISRANRDGKEIRFHGLPGQLHALAEISEVEDLLPLARSEAVEAGN